MTFRAGCSTALPIVGRHISRLLFPRLADNTVEMSEITDHSAKHPSGLEKIYGLHTEKSFYLKGLNTPEDAVL